MKNLFLLSVFVLGIGSSTTVSDSVLAKKVIVMQHQEKDYDPIEKSEVIAVVLEQLEKKYAGYILQVAAVALDGEYQLLLSNAETYIIAFFKADEGFIGQR